MENKAISRTLKLLAQLMELHGENSFKVKTVANAAFKVDKLPYVLKDKSLDEMARIDGLGKSTSGKIWELLQSGKINDLEQLLRDTPEGVVEMLSVKGIGPKKVLIIWKTLGIENIGELYYACNENRLIEAKGFGLKTQEEIKKVLEFQMASHGKFLYAQAEPLAAKLYEDLAVWLNGISGEPLLGIASAFRRCVEVVEELELVVGVNHPAELIARIAEFEPLVLQVQPEGTISGTSPFGLNIILHVVPRDEFYLEWFRHTGSTAHTDEILALAGSGPFDSEEAIYRTAGLAFIEPELREGLGETDLARSGNMPELIMLSDLKGCLHNHSTWSDGVNTLEEMALYCRDHLQLEYFGICDHSKSAVYANGLNELRIEAQHREIDSLNAQLAPFRIFKGIESDILYDGSLDYAEEILKRFDFVVASVHSNLRMDSDKATARLVKAVENPYTTILGHPTGRLLLSRKGYDIDYRKVIDACAANGVAIEVNSNPLRLDLDWRWHRYALEKGVMLSINPDAHRAEKLNDMRYGVLVARKGGLHASACLNALSREEISQYFSNKNS
ncbi:DNA polymerase/3'-5' exonuclease PolX [Pedobacter deserti]|uniref:DNA polymerase/3'-5' exonuclease PolX n=1 Tax=Pedobacter deserti TaxID=2817382 RepID=UPI00210A4C26|nr:DNA polymerase/3'-5' exonuclease PolX [Pedobacter sp. SYSU D00382]